MSRVVNTNGPGKRRNHHMRTCAELLRRLSQKTGFDDDSKDMLAALVYELRGIDDTLQEAVDAWEKRDFWIKAERFRHDWAWVTTAIQSLTNTIKTEAWAQVPVNMVELLPHFSSITVSKFTRDESTWRGKYKQLISE